MKILVIGGTKFLGYHLVRELLKKGHRVTLFNRGLTPDDFGPAVERIRGDRTRRGELGHQLKSSEFEVVVDMIAYRREETEEAVQTFSGRVGHFIHISTGSVYIVTRDYPCPLRESDFFREVIPRPVGQDDWWVYGVNKRSCELVLREAFEATGFPATIFRLPIVIGERDYTLRAYSYFLRVADGGPLLLPDAGMNVFTHVYQGDVVSTIARNLLNGKTFGQAYNLAMEEIISLRHFVQKSAEIIGKEVNIVDIPARLLEGLPMGTSFSPFSNRRPFVMAVEKARQDLNFLATPFSTWLARTINWFFTQYKGELPANYRWRPLELEVAEKFIARMEELKNECLSLEVKDG
ncbi:MAG: NAD-dependent epimerase/dehydratase family protein [Candidatus Aminicenantales bacterium]